MCSLNDSLLNAFKKIIVSIVLMNLVFYIFCILWDSRVLLNRNIINIKQNVRGAQRFKMWKNSERCSEVSIEKTLFS